MGSARSLRRRVLGAALAAALVTMPGFAAAVCAPAATAIFPASGIAGTSVTATISGEGLTGGTLTVYGDTGLTATVQSSTDIALTVRLDLAATAVPGERIIFVDTPGGTTGVSFVINVAGGPVVAAVGRDRLWATQFHPEKSGPVGMRVLANFVAASR